MTQRARLQLNLNEATEITLLFSEPITGKNQFGNYFMYAVSTNDGLEHSLFASPEVHSELSKLSKGQKAVLTKLAANRNGKLVTSYDVKLLSNEIKHSVAANSEDINEAEEFSPDESTIEDDLYRIMHRSYKQAIKISDELGLMGEIHKIAISLFIAKSKQSGF